MKKPSVYFQFDYDNFIKTQYKEGWFDYKKGYGPVSKDYRDIVNYIINYCDENFKIESKYLKNINDVFIYNDCKNSERVYNEIIRL